MLAEVQPSEPEDRVPTLLSHLLPRDWTPESHLQGLWHVVLTPCKACGEGPMGGDMESGHGSAGHAAGA